MSSHWLISLQLLLCTQRYGGTKMVWSRIVKNRTDVGKPVGADDRFPEDWQTENIKHYDYQTASTLQSSSQLHSLSCHMLFIVFWLAIAIMVSVSNHDLLGNFQSWGELNFWTQHDTIRHDRRRSCESIYEGLTAIVGVYHVV